VTLPLRGETDEDLEAEFDISKRTVKRWIAAGLPHSLVDGRRRYSFEEVRAWMDENGRTGERGRIEGSLNYEGTLSGDVKEDLLRAKLRKEIAQANRYELDVQQRRGELLERSEVEKGRIQRIAHAKATLMSTSTLAADLEGCNLEQRERKIEAWVEAALKELSKEDDDGK